MYNAFFGFKERPFQLVPNPAYLYLSKSHEEALAHLTYAISHGDGFVEIIGEVGTGKTTLCRVFLENLEDSTEAAYIFNPKLNALQLLKAINDEFGIGLRSGNIKDHIDNLNRFLMARKAEGKIVILVIDEAQNLSQEVLEQLRLLSNLETSTEKLLQIILVGQPELDNILHSYQLRQLGQRITLSCQLTPLTCGETREYIEHRIHIASSRPGVQFTSGAFQEIYNFSGGIPRLINIVCDRALLTAFGYNKLKITRSIARGAVRELRGKGANVGTALWSRRGLFVILAFSTLPVLAVLFWPGSLHRYFLPADSVGIAHLDERHTPQEKDADFPPAAPEEKKLPAAAPEDGTLLSAVPRDMALPPAAPEEKTLPPAGAEAGTAGSLPLMSFGQDIKEEDRAAIPADLIEVLPGLSSLASRRVAMQEVLSLWNGNVDLSLFEDVPDDRTFFNLAAKKNNLRVRRFEGKLPLLKIINLPAVLRFEVSGRKEPAYLALCGIGGDTATICGLEGGGKVGVAVTDIEKHWSGVAFVPWRDFMNIAGTLPEDGDENGVRGLKSLLRATGFTDLDDTPDYDEKTRLAVISLQKKYGIQIDGVVGSSTKIVLYNEDRSLPIPHIVQQEGR